MRRRIFEAVPVLLACLLPGAAAAQEHVTGGPTFHGFLFGDVTYVQSEREVPEGFLVGQLVGHGNATLSDRLGFFGEISLSARESGYAIEVERAILRYDFADALKLSAGRYHTPISYWNTAYHHGMWLQTSIARPELIKLGGAYLPVHFIGLLAEGTVNVTGAAFTYGAGVGNGRAGAITRAGDAGDVNGSRAVVLTAHVRPSALFGLQVGGSAYLDRVTPDGTGASASADERIVTAHAVWDRGTPELIAEVVHIRHEPDLAGAPAATNRGWYLHAGLDVGSFTPYGRIEKMGVDGDDIVFASLSEYEAAVVGVRWDFEALAALKTELRRERIAGDEARHSLVLQLALVVPSFVGM